MSGTGIRPLTVVVAPDSFKGSASARDAAAALATGWSSVRPDDVVVQKPMADGGEGTIDAFAAAVPGAVPVPVWVTGPDGRAHETAWLRLPATPLEPGGTGVVELASTSGITLLDTLAPLDAHTLGFGQAISAALDAGVSRLLLAIGGSSSTDGGAGVLAALGARLRTAGGKPAVPGGRGLADIVDIDFRELRMLPAGGVIVLGDVTNPLLGPRGAAVVYGPQKGADPSTVEVLERNLRHFAAVAAVATAGPGYRSGTGLLEDTPGAGAAGGTGYGLLLWGATLVSGAGAVAETIGLAGAIGAADIVITGEGSFDEQSADGKVPTRVRAAAEGTAATVLLVAGRISAPVDDFAASVSLTDLAGSSDASRGDALHWLRRAGADLARSVGTQQPRPERH
jgi:glycerate kinase